MFKFSKYQLEHLTVLSGLLYLMIGMKNQDNHHSLSLSLSRQATAVWYWAYCISVEEKTFENLIKLIDQYWEIKDNVPTPPFTSVE